MNTDEMNEGMAPMPKGVSSPVNEEEAAPEELISQSVIAAVRTTAGRERQVVERIESRARQHSDEMQVFAILQPHRVRGYVFVEAESLDDVRAAIYGITYVRGIIKGQVKLDELKHFLTPTPAAIKIDMGDVVELISGPFKSERAKVVRINKAKEEVVVELLDAVVPIPVTVKLESVRVIGRKNNEESKQ